MDREDLGAVEADDAHFHHAAHVHEVHSIANAKDRPAFALVPCNAKSDAGSYASRLHVTLSPENTGGIVGHGEVSPQSAQRSAGVAEDAAGPAA